MHLHVHISVNTFMLTVCGFQTHRGVILQVSYEYEVLLYTG